MVLLQAAEVAPTSAEVMVTALGRTGVGADREGSRAELTGTAVAAQIRQCRPRHCVDRERH